MPIKYIILCFFMLSFCTVSVGQELAIIRDTVNHFSIGVPKGWRYGAPTDKSAKFIAIRQKLNDKDRPRENFNINIFPQEETDMEKTYGEFMESVGRAEGFKIIEQGERVIKKRKYKYLLETHKNKVSKEDMNNYVLFTNKKGEILILTMVTTSENFKKFEELFDRIGKSLSY